mgnify:CR=1 FL=1
MDDKDPQLTRRRLLAGAVSLGAAAALPLRAATPGDPPWDDETDVLVVGTGAAGSAAAVFARQAGAAVLMVEKADYYGGTTAKSQGGYWVPNNSLMRARGLSDPRDAALRYMARLAHPESYHAQQPMLGLAARDHELIATFYDNAARVIDALGACGALASTFFPGGAGFQYMPDYYAHLPENAAPFGRILSPRMADGSPGLGIEIARQFEAAMKTLAVPVRFGHRAQRLLMDAAGAVIGLELATGAGDVRRIRARRGVIFGTGGFIHNPQLRREFLRGTVYGGCTVPAAQGDLIPIAIAAGAQLGNMQNAWWSQVVFEQALANSAVPMNVFVPPGDSMLQVNRYGQRFVNEKFVYNERTQLHFVWDPVRAEFTNLLTFMIYDQRTAEQFAGMYPVPQGAAPYVLRADTLDGLAGAIGERLASLEHASGSFSLDVEFAQNLKRGVERFNNFATSGLDQDFQRGGTPIEQYFHALYRPPGQQNPAPNATLHPLAARGPYYAIILCAGVLDTKGGPKIDVHARMLDAAGQPLPGLYGAGNCIAAPAAQAYWSAGATIGSALVFGALAGEHAATRTPASA